MTGPSGGTATAAISEAWDLQSVWSQAADRLKKQVERARLTSLLLGVAAAVLGTAASQTLTWNEAVGKPLAFAAAVAAGCAPLTGRRGGPGSVSDWIRLRAVAESLKSETYICLARVGGYRTHDDAGALLRERTRGFLAEADDLRQHTAGITAVERSVPEIRDLGSYVEVRLRRQLDGYYRPRAARMRHKVELHERIEVVLGGLGAVLAAGAATWNADRLAAWVAVAASMAVAATAHAVAQRYAYQQLEFTRTGDELERLLRQCPDGAGIGAAGAESVDRFVSECEHAISVQNEAWMIRWRVG